MALETFLEKMAEILNRIDYRMMLVAMTERGMVPVGLVMAAVHHRAPPNRDILEPHVVWFKWSRLRNHVEAAVAFLNSARCEYFVTIYAESKDKAFFTHMCKYGILQRVGTLIGYFANGDCCLFQGRPANGAEHRHAVP